jgi:hypothetical protein
MDIKKIMNIKKIQVMSNVQIDSRYMRYRVMRTPTIYCVFHSLIFRQFVQLISDLVRLNQGAQALEDL